MMDNDVTGYEPIDYFYPYLSTQGEREMQAMIEKLGLVSNHDGNYHTEDGMYLMSYRDSGHERDSSNDCWILFKRLET